MVCLGFEPALAGWKAQFRIPFSMYQMFSAFNYAMDEDAIRNVGKNLYNMIGVFRDYRLQVRSYQCDQ